MSSCLQTSAAVKALSFLNGSWKNVVFAGVSPAPKGGLLGYVHGGFALGASMAVLDVCLLCPSSLDATTAAGTLSQLLLARRVECVWAGAVPARSGGCSCSSVDVAGSNVWSLPSFSSFLTADPRSFSSCTSHRRRQWRSTARLLRFLMRCCSVKTRPSHARHLSMSCVRFHLTASALQLCRLCWPPRMLCPCCHLRSA